MLSSMACFQGWSAIYQYTWAHTRADFRPQGMKNHFNASEHPAKMGLMPFGALVFRQGLVPPATSRVELQAGDEVIFGLASQLNGSLWGSWRELWKQKDNLTGQLALENKTALDFPDINKTRTQFKSGEGQILTVQRTGTAGPPPWHWDTASGIFVLNTPAARVWCGAVSGRELPAGDASCHFGELPAPAPHATVTIAAVDGQPLVKSKRALVTAMRRAENIDVKWNAARDSVDDNWGHGPVGVVGLNAELALPGAPWRIVPLDAQGAPVEKARRTGCILTITPADSTIWYLLER